MKGIIVKNRKISQKYICLLCVVVFSLGFVFATKVVYANEAHYIVSPELNVEEHFINSTPNFGNPIFFAYKLPFVPRVPVKPHVPDNPKPKLKIPGDKIPVNQIPEETTSNSGNSVEPWDPFKNFLLPIFGFIVSILFLIVLGGYVLEGLGFIDDFGAVLGNIFRRIKRKQD